MDFEYYLYDLLTNEKISKDIIKLILEPDGFEVIKESYKQITWNISEKEFKQIIIKYNKLLDNIYIKFPYFKKLNINPAIFVRYELMGFLNNISLSFPQNKKLELKKLGITHELFGSVFNTHPSLTYCCLFPDLEAPRCKSNFYDFSPFDHKDISGYLINPPYTKSYINSSSERVLEWLSSNKKQNLRFLFILPLWDNKSRELYNLPISSDLPIIKTLIESKYTVYHRIIKGKDFQFYDGTKNKLVNLKDPIHIMILQDGPDMIWNKNIEQSFNKILLIT